MLNGSKGKETERVDLRREKKKSGWYFIKNMQRNQFWCCLFAFADLITCVDKGMNFTEAEYR